MSTAMKRSLVIATPSSLIERVSIPLKSGFEYNTSPLGPMCFSRMDRRAFNLQHNERRRDEQM
jgi:hypothetical protein